MVYRNTVTDALIETSCQVSGGNWVAVPTAAQDQEAGTQGEEAGAQGQEAGAQGPQERPPAPPAGKARKAKVSGQ
nr:MAG TPA: hypothetical protein [Caudoviricetes sp.]